MLSGESDSFGFMRPFWPGLAELGRKAEQAGCQEPDRAAIRLRGLTEAMVVELVRHLELPYNPSDTAFDRLVQIENADLLDARLLSKFHTIRKLGNSAAHNVEVTEPQAAALLEDAWSLCCWFCRFMRPDVEWFTPLPQGTNRTDDAPEPIVLNSEPEHRPTVPGSQSNALAFPDERVRRIREQVSRAMAQVDPQFRQLRTRITLQEAFTETLSNDQSACLDALQSFETGIRKASECCFPMSTSGNVDGGTWLVRPERGFAQLLDSFEGIAFVGVDFGTATTVVSLVVRNDSERSIAIRPLTLSQPSLHGGVVRDEIVNTVLAFRNDTLLFGRDAYNLRSRLTEGRNTFSSFKMGLGLDLGPEFGATVLPAGRVPGITIERPADAAREFFKLLMSAVHDELAQLGLTRGARFAFSVPAAFQANQRRDLMAAIRGCGIEVDESCLIDEPNAAFLGYVHEVARSPDGQDLLVRAKAGQISVLVYDLGAGTCDVSLLDFSISANRVTSRNRAISKFTALGGDDIDREIARRILLGQLRQADGSVVELTTLDIEEKVVPALAPAAEKLKVTISKMMADKSVGRIDAARRLPDLVFETQAVPPFKLRGAVVGIETPALSLHQFLDILGPFLGPRSGADASRHLAGPVHDVLDKASLDPGDVDAVLFIGGSAQNPLVRAAVMDLFPPEVREVVPRNLRALVSQGAAIHSLGLHGFGFDFIAPITSEAISVVARGGLVETLIPASTPVPTEAPFVIQLSIPDDGQRQLDVPICSGGRDKLVGIVSVKPAGSSGFACGDAVIVTGRLSKEKLLDVTVTVAGRTARAEIMNPLSNSATSPAELVMLRERQRFNESMLRNNGRPEAGVVKAYSQAAAKAGEHELAADLLVALERITPGSDHATNICYHYSIAGRDRASHEWAAIAHRRRPTAQTAHNLACGERDAVAKEQLLREALDRDPGHTSSAAILASMIEGRSPAEARQLREGIVAALEPAIPVPDTDLNDLRRLRDAARATGQAAAADRATAEIERREREVATRDAVFHEENLAQGRSSGRLLGRER